MPVFRTSRNCLNAEINAGNSYEVTGTKTTKPMSTRVRLSRQVRRVTRSRSLS
jgi:hypothetical protein